MEALQTACSCQPLTACGNQIKNALPGVSPVRASLWWWCCGSQPDRHDLLSAQRRLRGDRQIEWGKIYMYIQNCDQKEIKHDWYCSSSSEKHLHPSEVCFQPNHKPDSLTHTSRDVCFTLRAYLRRIHSSQRLPPCIGLLHVSEVGSVCEDIAAAHREQCQLEAWNGTYRFFSKFSCAVYTVLIPSCFHRKTLRSTRL